MHKPASQTLTRQNGLRATCARYASDTLQTGYLQNAPDDMDAHADCSINDQTFSSYMQPLQLTLPVIDARGDLAISCPLRGPYYLQGCEAIDPVCAMHLKGSSQ